MRKFLVINEIEPIICNKEYVRLPLHCTLVHWFYTEQTHQTIVEIIRPVLQVVQPFEVVSEKSEWFGRDRTVPVHTIEPNDSLWTLHHSLLNVLSPYIESYEEPEYVGNGYRPHVTTHDRAFTPGEYTMVTHIYIPEIIREHGRKRTYMVNERIQLGGGP